MGSDQEKSYIAFAGSRRVVSGNLAEVAAGVKTLTDQGDRSIILVLDAVTSEPVELDLRGTLEDVLRRVEVGPPGDPAASRAAGPAADAARPAASTDGPAAAGRGPGRPRLGVVAREVTLLPRHWEWLSEQPGGASVTLRKLVEEARKSTAGEVRLRQAREACYRFMNVIAGNEPGFEEAIRALFAGNRERLEAEIEQWPTDVRDHVRELADRAS